MTSSLLSGLLLISVLVFIYLLMDRWVSGWNTDALAAAAGRSADGKSLNQFGILILERTIASIFRERAIRRLAVLSLLLPMLSLSMSGVLTRTIGGFTQAPWTAYQSLVDMTVHAQELQVQQSKNSADRARALDALAITRKAALPYWQYVYAAITVLIVAGANFLALSLSTMVARIFLKEMANVAAPLQRISLLFLAAFTLWVIAVMLFVIITLPTNPITWLPLLVALLQVPAWIKLAAILGAAPIVWDTSGICVKALVVGPLLPCVGFLVLCVPEVLSALFRDSFQRWREQLFGSLQKDHIAALSGVVLLLFLTFMVVRYVLKI